MKKFMDTFIDLLKSSTLIQALITFTMLVTITVLILTNRVVPDILTNAFLLILGYYFGTKSQQALERNIKAFSRKDE